MRGAPLETRENAEQGYDRDIELSGAFNHGAESMRQAILQNLPGGQICDPQLIADMIRAIALP